MHRGRELSMWHREKKGRREIKSSSHCVKSQVCFPMALRTWRPSRPPRIEGKLEETDGKIHNSLTFRNISTDLAILLGLIGVVPIF